MDLLKHIYIFPGLKEVSKNGKRYQEECGITSSTNENCMGDYDEEKNEMIHRKNYSSSKSLQNKFPNSYLGDENFIVQNDMCLHRMAPLSEGRIEGNNIQCGYHGWEFNSKGQVVNIPQNDKRKLFFLPRKRKIRRWF